MRRTTGTKPHAPHDRGIDLARIVFVAGELQAGAAHALGKIRPEVASYGPSQSHAVSEANSMMVTAETGQTSECGRRGGLLHNSLLDYNLAFCELAAVYGSGGTIFGEALILIIYSQYESFLEHHKTLATLTYEKNRSHQENPEDA